MSRNLDGVKKIDRGEAKKYRKIIFGYVGEREAAAAAVRDRLNQPPALAKKVDGIRINRVGLSETEQVRLKQAIKKQEEERKKIKEEERQYFLSKKRAVKDEAERLKREEQNKKAAVRQARWQAEESARLAERKKWQEKIRLEEAKREAAKLAARAVRQKRWAKRRQAWREFKKNLRCGLAESFLFIRRNSLNIGLLFIVLVAVVYAGLSLAVLRFKVDNSLVKAAENYLPTPAVISNLGLINFNEYQILKNDNYQKADLASWIILRELKNKYGLGGSSTAEDLALKFALDDEANQVGILRIKKISQLVAGGYSLEQAAKYADEYNAGAYYDAGILTEKFGRSVKDLTAGEIGEVIARPAGYYLVEITGSGGKQIGVKYLFVAAKSVDDYIKEKIKNVKIFILAD